MTTKLSTILNTQGQSNNFTVIPENRDPLPSDTAILGTIWINESTNRFFICTDDTVANISWESGAGGEPVATDTRDPNSADLGNVGSLWINTDTNNFFICTDDTPGSTIWKTDTQIDVLLETNNPDKNNSGHPLGTLWINTTNKRLFFCVDNTSSNAIWKSTIEVINETIDPTIDDYQYPLGTIWINASNEAVDKKSYFILIDNTPGKAIWSKNETDVYWITDPIISGSTTNECDETIYTYNATGSYSAIDEASTITYRWSLSNGVLLNSTGNSVNLYFTNAERDSIQILSCYAEDDMGYISETINFPINVRVVNLVDDLTLSLPNKIYTNESSFYDITVGYTGGDHTLNYFWETSENGTNWTSVFMVNHNLKLSEAIITNPGTTYIRCTVTNLAGPKTITSGPIRTLDITSDSDSTYLDTDIHDLENKEYDGTYVSSDTLGVKTLMFNVNDRVIVNGEQDNVSAVTEVYDNQMNIVTDEQLLNNDYSSYTTICTIMGNKVLVAYIDSEASGKGVIRVGTFNGETISFGDPVEFNDDYSQYIKILPLDNNKFIIVYRDDGNNNLGGSKVGTVLGDTVEFGSEVIFNSVDTNYIDVCKISSDRFAIAYSDYGTGNLGTLVVGQVSGNSITYGSQQVYTDSAFFNSIDLIDDNKLCITYQDNNNSNYGTAIIAGVSGTSLSLGSPHIFNNDTTAYVNVNKVATNKIVISYQNVGSSGHGYSIVGTVSATSISFGTAVSFESTNTRDISTIYNNNRLFVAYRDGSGSNKGNLNFASISGTTISFENSIIFNDDESHYIQAYNLHDNKIALTYKDGGDSDKGKMKIYTPFYQEITLENETVTSDTIITRLNTEYTLPIIRQQDPQDIFEKVEMSIQTQRNNLFDANEESSKIVVRDYEISPYVIGDRVLLEGDTIEHDIITDINRSIISGTGSSVKGDNFVFNNINTQKISSVAIDDRYMICAFRDNSTSGSVIYGEVKYNEIFFENKITFTGVDIDYISTAKIDNEKVVIVYQDKSSGYGRALIAKVTDGILNIGSLYTFNSNETEHINVERLADNSFIITYQDNGDAGKGKCIVGTASDISLSFGSENIIDADNITFTSVKLIDTDKIAVSYRNVTNSGAGTIKIGTVSGNNVTFGSAQIFSSTSSTYIDMDILADNKLIIKYTDYPNNLQGTAIVGTISGNTVTFGSSKYFNTDETYYSSVVTVSDNVFIIVYDNYNEDKGFSKVGTVSGSTITFDNPVEINNGTTSHIDTFKIDNKKIVATFCNQDSSYKGTAQIIRRDIDLIKSEIEVENTIPSNLSTIELLSYKIDASIGDVQSFDSTEYYHTDLDETYQILNDDILLTNAIITTKGDNFYSRIKSINTDEFHKHITRIDINFWIED
jgi:hypothetical protein